MIIHATMVINNNMKANIDVALHYLLTHKVTVFDNIEKIVILDVFAYTD